MDPLDLIARSAAAAFATDEHGRVVIWNRGAEELLGYPAARVLGKSCHDILCGEDVFGNRFCDRGCALVNMARRQETIRHFELEVRRESGERISVSFSIVTVQGAKASHFSVIHFIQLVDRHLDVNALIRRILAEAPAPVVDRAVGAATMSATPMPLTAREVQILRLLADGASTRVIADSLSISVATTRNHIQNVLRKLEVHSKLEAVSLALRHHLF